MAKRGKAYERAAVRREDRVRPTRQTVRRLTDDPLLLLTEGLNDSGRNIHPHETDLMREAAEEIGLVYMSIVGALMSRHRWYDETPGFEGIPEWIARAHAQRYLPWVRRTGRLTIAALIEIVIDRRPVLKPPRDELRAALLDYWS